VAAALPALDGFAGDVLVVLGDTPLMTTATLRRLVDARGAAEGDPAVAVLGFRPADPGPYGRLIRAADGSLARIVEAADATAEERAVDLCNSGVLLFDGARLADLIGALDSDNAKGEFYLTDTVALARARGWTCAVAEAPAGEVHGVNSRADLAVAEAMMQERLRAAAMAEGATLIDPSTVHFSWDTRLGRDVVVQPHVVFGPGVAVADAVEIGAFSHLEQATVGAGARVGPYARLRPGTDVGDGAHVGNFVELKNAVLGPGAKANHLTYLGDASVGPGANIGAGTITCNYDGVFKHRTEIGAEAFIGSNAALVAPVRVGDRANVGAGSVIGRDVPDDAFVVERGETALREGGAARYRARLHARKQKDRAGG
jgi:bifunctional UDP-N-acetylglucosamine pyrophosphorylase/glucosamine-1-phosphate N-acetyltransferase